MTFRTLVAALAALLPLTAATPASAASSDAGTVTGLGTIWPGLWIEPTSHLLTFTGTMTSAGTSGLPASSDCAFSGQLNQANVAGGFGVLSGSCGHHTFPTCVVTFAGSEWAWLCVTPLAAALAAFECVFTPVDFNPVTVYALQCAGAAGRA